MPRQVTPGFRTPLHTSLPASPLDGQEIRFLADATNGVVWTLRYRAASASAYKWEFVGGPGLESKIEANETTSNTGWVNLATAGPDIILPLAGDYDTEWGAIAYASGGAYVGYMGIADASVSGTPISRSLMWRYDNQMSGATRQRLTGLVAAHTHRATYSSPSGVAYYWSCRYLRMTPVRVG